MTPRDDVPEVLAELLAAISEAMVALLRLGAAGRDSIEAAALRAELERLNREVGEVTRQREAN
jgi:hypothetical protein